MDADWYEDPLGRFDGRFFNGAKWTERVSDDGSSAIDPDFPPASIGGSDEPDGWHTPGGLESPHDQQAPAVAPVAAARHLKASLMEESPVRTVAVLDPALARPDSDKVRSQAPIVWSLLGLIAALVVAGLLLWDRGQSNEVTEPVELDQDQEARVQDLEEGGVIEQLEPEAVEDLAVDAPVGAVEPGTRFAASELIKVGGLRVLNGTSVLDDLGEWHREFAAERGVELDAGAGCWFGQLGGAAVQVAHCGPVGGSADIEFRFDSVPLLFEESDGGQIAQPVVDAVVLDAVLANALTLVGTPDNPPPSDLSD